MSPSSMPDHRPMETKRTVKEKIFQEFKEVVPMFLYLWLLFALFTYHEAIVLARHNISYAPFGLAFINAFVFAKVMLIAEKLRIGTRFRKKAPVFPIFTSRFSSPSPSSVSISRKRSSSVYGKAKRLPRAFRESGAAARQEQ